MTRISSLPGLGQCPGFSILRACEGGSSAAADTGSAVGRICELWHRGGESGAAFEEAVSRAMVERAAKFPQADMDSARTWALAYACDPRNRAETAGGLYGPVVADLCEREVRLELPPAPEDPTRKPVRLIGHIDQARRAPDGVLRVWDLKSGKAPGLEMLYGYAWQLAAYALACTETLGEPVLPGGIIRLRAYETKAAQGSPHTATAFFEAPWTLDQCRTMLATAVQHVAWLRAGLVHLQPGIHCQWCPGRSPATCGDKLDRLPVWPEELVA